MRQHPALGVEMLRPISDWRALAPAIHTHHERWDGKGYPRGLAGVEIPLGGRVVAVAEAFEAMTRSMPDRPRRSVDEALAEVEACAGTQFDPAIARLFVEEYRANRDRLGGRRSGGYDVRQSAAVVATRLIPRTLGCRSVTMPSVHQGPFRSIRTSASV